jgi:hypothetical protein
MAKYEVTPWEFLDAETNAKFQFRQNSSGEKLLDTYTIRFESDNTDKNGKSLGTVNKVSFDEVRATLYFIWKMTNSEEEFIDEATKIYQKKRRFTTMRVPIPLVSEFESRINDFLGDDF